MPAYPVDTSGGQLVIGLWPMVNPMCTWEGLGCSELWLPGPLRGGDIETPDGYIDLPRKRGQHRCNLYVAIDPDVDVNGDPLPGGEAGLFHNLRAMQGALIDPIVNQDGDGALPAVWTPHTGAAEWTTAVTPLAINAGTRTRRGWRVSVDIKFSEPFVEGS